LPQQVEPLDPDGLLPNRIWVLWPNTRLDDPRFHWQNDHLVVAARPQERAAKLGYLNRQGWAGYIWEQIFFVKRFTPQPEKTYPDFGCNVEVYANDRFIELETLGPLAMLVPGQSARHREVWEIYPSPVRPRSLEEALLVLECIGL
jgi:hypothetical protein